MCSPRPFEMAGVGARRLESPPPTCSRHLSQPRSSSSRGCAACCGAGAAMCACGWMLTAPTRPSLRRGQPSVALEVHHTGPGTNGCAWLGVSCPRGLEPLVHAALQAAYPNCGLTVAECELGIAPSVLRVKKHTAFLRRSKPTQRFEFDREPPVNRLLTVMGACGEPAFVQISLTPTPAAFESFARCLFKHQEARI